MGKNKLKQQLKRQQRDVVGTAASASSDAGAGNARPNKKQKTQEATETEVEIDSLGFDDALAAGLAFEQLESYEGALAAFERAVQCEPKHLGALTHLADVHSAAGQLDEALHCYVKASELEDGEKDASVWFRLGLAHAALEQQLKATKAYEKSMELTGKAVRTADEEAVVELKKAYGVTLAALAEAFGEVGDLDSAVKVFEDAVATFPQNANFHYNLANMRMARSGSTGVEAFDSEVVKCLELAIELSPETRDFVEDLAAYLEQHDQQQDQVCQLKAKAEKLQPTVPTAEDESEQKRSEASDSEEEEGGESQDEKEEEGEEE